MWPPHRPAPIVTAVRVPTTGEGFPRGLLLTSLPPPKRLWECGWCGGVADDGQPAERWKTWWRRQWGCSRSPSANWGKGRWVAHAVLDAERRRAAAPKRQLQQDYDVAGCLLGHAWRPPLVRTSPCTSLLCCQLDCDLSRSPPRTCLGRVIAAPSSLSRPPPS